MDHDPLDRVIDQAARHMTAGDPSSGFATDVFDRIERSGEFLSVIWRQELAAVARALVAPGRPLGELVFLFDAAGRLVEIDDTARVRFD